MWSKQAGVALLMFILFFPQPAKSLSLIRDAETEGYLKLLATPVLQAAKLNPDHVKIIIVNSSVINAFVAGGQNIFLHTGLIIQDEKDPAQLIGVIAHEVGHILGGHLIRKRQELEDVSLEATLTSLLGIASMALGAVEAGNAIFSGGQHVAQRHLLKYSRSHEEAADQTALHLLEEVGVSPRGILSLLQFLMAEETVALDEKNSYRRTHPLSQERVMHVRSTLERKPDLDRPSPQKLQLLHRRIVTKLKAFLRPPSQVLQEYRGDSVNDRYARAIALYRVPDIEKALTEINGLIEDYPKDAYFHELKGQMLFEHSRIKESIPAYRKAFELAPSSQLIRMELAVAQMATEEDEGYKEAVDHLEYVVVSDSRNGYAWYQLGIAYGRMDNLAMSYVALAEAARLRNKIKEAKEYLALAERYLKEDKGDDRGSAWLRFNDVKQAVKQNKKR